MMTTVKTFTATIYVGLLEKYDEFGNEFTGGILHTIDQVEEVCQGYCNGAGLCVTVTPTKFIYTKRWEPGCIVGLINYPRFPSTE